MKLPWNGGYRGEPQEKTIERLQTEVARLEALKDNEAARLRIETLEKELDGEKRAHAETTADWQETIVAKEAVENAKVMVERVLLKESAENSRLKAVLAEAAEEKGDLPVEELRELITVKHSTTVEAFLRWRTKGLTADEQEAWDRCVQASASRCLTSSYSSSFSPEEILKVAYILFLARPRRIE